MSIDYARPDISVFTETTGILERQAREAASREAMLFRDCPSAFWLDGDRLPAGHAPLMSAPRHQILHATPRPDPVEERPIAIAGRTAGAWAAMIAAGPLFLTLLVLSTDDGMRSGWQRIAMALVMAVLTSPLSIVFGVLLGCLPITIGTAAMSELGRVSGVSRQPWLWAATGGGMGLGIAGLFDAGTPGTLPLIVTSAVCAAIVRHFVVWTDADPA